MKFPSFLSFFVSAAAILLASTTAHAASLTGIDLFDNISYQQTSTAVPTTPVGYFFNVGGSFNSSATGSVNVTFPGSASPLSVPASGSSFNYGSPFLPSLSSVHSAYAFGTYTYSYGGQSPSIAYTADHFTSAIPALSASTYTGLQGLNAAAGFTLHFNSFTAPDATVNEEDTFFTIFDATTNAVVFTDGFLNDSTTSLFLPGGTLSAGTQYDYELDFSDRVNGSNSGIGTVQGFDVRTDGTFTTSAAAMATPEPATVGICGLCLISLAAALRRKP